MIDKTTAVKNTEKLLKCISAHLSSRKDCKGVVYQVRLGDYSSRTIAKLEDNWITMYPEIKIFPDRYHRKVTDKTSVLDHVIKIHMPEILVDVNPQVVYDCNSLLRGEYEYQLSASGKQRRWVKVR